MNTNKAEALKEAKRVLKDRMDFMLRQARELERTLQRLDEEEALASHSDLFNWAVNDLNNMLMNLGMAELCRTQAKLELAR